MEGDGGGEALIKNDTVGNEYHSVSISAFCIYGSSYERALTFIK